MSHALNLPAEFTQIKTAYNIFVEKWTVNNLITKYVAEEEKLKKERSELALLTIYVKPHSGKNSWKIRKIFIVLLIDIMSLGNQIMVNTIT